MRQSSSIVEELSTGTLLKNLSVFEPTPIDLERLGLSVGPLKLRRVWPRSSEQLGLEYIAGDGCIIPGQWFRQAQRLEHVAQATIKASPKAMVAIVNVGDTQILLQGGGADRRLPSLAPLLKRPGTQLLVHQPERRAVVRLKSSGKLRYVKVVRPERAQMLAATGRAMHNLVAGAFAAPELLEVSVEAGALVWSALPGLSLYELSGSAQLILAARATGQALNALHAKSPPLNTAVHRAGNEISVLQSWLGRLEAFAPNLGGQIRATAAGVCRTLAVAPSPPVLLHRDFYDKQALIDAAGRIGLLDFDTLAMGEAALDLANALVHFELRALQGRYPLEHAAAASAAMLEGYQPSSSTRRRLNVYADATRLRLVCVYAFRPRWVSLIPALLGRVGRAYC